MSTLDSFEEAKDRLRANMSKYTRRAWFLIEETGSPKILDAGCGTGVPTMTLAGLSRGKITSVDIDKAALERLSNKVSKAGLGTKITVMEKSLKDLDFEDGAFDTVWAEGSIFVVGFEQGIKDWRRLIRPGGCLVIHDDKGDVDDKLRIVEQNRYEVIEHFIIDNGAWMKEYYDPLQKLVDEYRSKQEDGSGLIEALDTQQKEIDMVKAKPEICASVFFVLKKPEE